MFRASWVVLVRSTLEVEKRLPTVCGKMEGGGDNLASTGTQVIYTYVAYRQS